MRCRYLSRRVMSAQNLLGRCLIALAVVVMGVLAYSSHALAMTTSGTPQTGSPSPTAAQLIRNYLQALGPAGTRITKVEAELKALPTRATTAQVQAIVSSLGSALKPIENLVYGEVDLISVPETSSCVHYGITPQEINGQSYPQVLELTGACRGGTLGSGAAMVTWNLDGRYHTLKLDIDVSEENVVHGWDDDVIFIDPSDNTRLTFTADGVRTAELHLAGTTFVSVTINVTGLQGIEWRALEGFPAVDDIVDAVLS